MMTGRIEQVSAMGWVDIEENPWNDNSLFFQQFFKECLETTISPTYDIQIFNIPIHC